MKEHRKKHRLNTDLPEATRTRLIEHHLEMERRRIRQRSDVANSYAVVISKYIPAGAHRNVPKTNR